jgi:catechol 2,3-dioxygenase-like lactoylglutathione lyase family enzyme
METAFPFYRTFAAQLGYTREFHTPVWKVFAAEGELPQASYLSLIEDRDHQPNANRLAFWAASPEEVDAVAAVLEDAGATAIEGPGPVPEVPGTYYAVFFEDPSGNRLEVYFRAFGSSS